MRLFAFPGFEVLKDGTIEAQPAAVFEFPRMEFNGPRGTRLRIHVQSADLVLVGVSQDGGETWTYAGVCRGTTFVPSATAPSDLIYDILNFFSALFRGEANLVNVRYLPANVKEEAPPPANVKKAELKVQATKRADATPPAPVAAVSKSRALAGGR